MVTLNFLRVVESPSRSLTPPSMSLKQPRYEKEAMLPGEVG